MKLHDLCPDPGATKKRTRKGRGIASGKGKTAGRGTKGQNSRSGGGKGAYFEGGQLPLVRRLPHKRGFQNRYRASFAPVNLASIAAWECEVTPETLAASGLIKNEALFVVILGEGKLDRALTVKAHRFSASAKAKIEAAGGSVEVLPLG